VWVSSDTGEKMGFSETVHQLFVDFKKAYDSFRRTALCSILIELGSCEIIAKFIYVNISLMRFLFKMVKNKEMLYLGCFSTLR
jgi:hypothetical protein